MNRFFSVMVVLFCVVFFVSSGHSDMYSYTDDSGAVCMTNSLESVPKKYRNSMTVTREVVPAQKKLLPEVQKRSSDPAPYVAPAVKAEPAVAATAPVDNRPRYVRTALVVAGIIAAYLVFSNLAGSLGFPRVGVLLSLGALLLGGVYLYGLYVNELRSVFGSLRKDAVNIRKNVETRELKTDQMLKKIDEAEQR